MSEVARRLRVLIVEDDPADAELNAHALIRAGLGASIDMAVTFDEVEVLLAGEPYDVILSDYRLRGWTGLDVLELVRSRCPTVPVILVTGTIGEEQAVECIDFSGTVEPDQRRSHVGSYFTTVSRLVTSPYFILEKVRMTEGI
jgi:CheY-like chemotaxis protein